MTWDKRDHGTDSLRGCIGTLNPQAISQLRDYTYSRWVGQSAALDGTLHTGTLECGRCRCGQEAGKRGQARLPIALSTSSV